MLGDEQIHVELSKNPPVSGGLSPTDRDRRLIKAQEKATIAEIKAWGNEICREHPITKHEYHNMYTLIYKQRRECPQCWKELG